MEKRTILSNGVREVAMETEAGLEAAVALPRRVPAGNSFGAGRELGRGTVGSLPSSGAVWDSGCSSGAVPITVCSPQPC